MGHLVDSVAASVITITLILINNDRALSLCTKIPWNMTVEEQGCLTTTFSGWACLGQCHTSTIPIASKPFYKEETQCCGPARFNTTSVSLVCSGDEGPIIRYKMVKIIEECACLYCYGEHRPMDD